MICDDPNPDKIIEEAEIINPEDVEEGGGGQNANKGNRIDPETVSFHHLCISNQ